MNTLGRSPRPASSAPHLELSVPSSAHPIGRRPTRFGNRLILTAVLAFGVISGYQQGPTLAFFTDTTASTANTFSTGTIDISSSPTSALISLSTIIPGDKVTQPLTVTNGPSLQLRYAMSSSVTNADSKGLGAELTLTIKTGVTCTNAGFGTGGSTVYATAALGNLGSSRNIIGTPGSTPNGGRTLNTSSNEVLCFQIALPATASTAFQGATTTATFTISGEQT